MNSSPLPLLLEQVVVRHAIQQLRLVLDHADLRIAPKERVCILGESGSGKTTLLEVISGFRRPDAGQVQLFGIDPAGAADRVRARLRRRDLGFIFQDYALIEGLTALANIALPLRLDGIRSETASQRASERLAALNLTHLAAVPASALSGGEKQRVAFARATIHKPRLILADEPTGSLDPHTGTAVLEMILGRGEDSPHSLVMVTHNHRHARQFDRVMLLRDGRLRETCA